MPLIHRRKRKGGDGVGRVHDHRNHHPSPAALTADQGGLEQMSGSEDAGDDVGGVIDLPVWNSAQHELREAKQERSEGRAKEGEGPRGAIIVGPGSALRR